MIVCIQSCVASCMSKSMVSSGRAGLIKPLTKCSILDRPRGMHCVDSVCDKTLEWCAHTIIL